MKMNGDAKGGRLKGVSVGFDFVGSGDDDGCSLRSALFSSAEVSGNGCKKRMAFGLTETMSPGARRVFALSCCEESQLTLHGRFHKRGMQHLLAIEQDISMNDEPSSLVNAVRKAAAKYKDVDPSLDLRKHQTANGRQSLQLFLFLFQVLHSVIFSAGEGIETCGVVSRGFYPRTYVW
jgi:hypothetical protein